MFLLLILGGVDRYGWFPRASEQEPELSREKAGKSDFRTQQAAETARKRLVWFYKYGRIGYLFPLLAASEPGDFPENVHRVSRMMRRDREIFARVAERPGEIHGIVESLDGHAREERLKDLPAEKKPTPGPPGEGIGKGDPVSKTRSGHPDRREPGASPSNGTAEGRDPFGSPFAAMQKALPLPTPGELKRTFGKSPGASKKFLYNNGTLILAPKGQPVVAVHDGVVVFADWVKEYGQVVIVNHGDHYFTLLAHLDQVFKGVGEPVQGGETIALVGDSGSTDGSKLYFEIRQGGRPLDPKDWLAAHTTMKE
ncbi:MAG TPA: peptidoglycan DD-metalloendopeptidase family protein [Syntrophobacteraceae bacterium]|nr:peptidoglycan DD-metalloendopeptidase family protein [Syntrophobacteraceae bacterium]